MCSNHQNEFHNFKTGRVQEMIPFRTALSEGRVTPVEFGPTTILQVQAPHVFKYVRVRGWDLGCSEMPPKPPVATMAQRVKPNHHRSWPRVCKKPGHLPPDYVRIVEAMRKRQQTESIQTHTRLQSDPLVTGGSHSGGKATVGELAHLQACLYQTVDAWAELARQEKIRWAACGGTLFGAMCYHSMPLWDDDIDITVPPSDCKLLDRIWEKATPVGSDSWPRPRDDGWEPRRLHHLNLTVWKTSKGAAATNFHRCRNPCFSS